MESIFRRFPTFIFTTYVYTRNTARPETSGATRPALEKHLAGSGLPAAPSPESRVPGPSCPDARSAFALVRRVGQVSEDAT